jgi:alginate O-acetyltransferase complex protein AlgJ
MKPEPPPQVSPQRWLLAAVFLTLILMPLADSALGLDHARSLNEKRLPAKFPKFATGGSGLRAFLAGLEAYYADHFGFRKRLLRWEQRWKAALFHESTVSDVMIGRDGWLFIANFNMIDNWRGARPLTAKELKNWQILVEKRRDWLARRGIKYLFVIAPNKETIYPEFLPEWMTRVSSTTRLDQFMAYMKEHSTVEVLDLRPVLIEAKKRARIYLVTDTHWNYYGGFIAYQAIMQALRHQLPGLDEPLPLAAFEIRYSQKYVGDLATALGQEKSMPEKDFVLLAPRPPLQPVKCCEDTNILNKKWTIGAYPVYSENAHQKYKALFFRDSFSDYLKVFFGRHFKRVVYIWLCIWDTSVIEREQPDVVVDQIVERGFNEWNPAGLARDDALP